MCECVFNIEKRLTAKMIVDLPKDDTGFISLESLSFADRLLLVSGDGRGLGMKFKECDTIRHIHTGRKETIISVESVAYVLKGGGRINVMCEHFWEDDRDYPYHVVDSNKKV